MQSLSGAAGQQQQQQPGGAFISQQSPAMDLLSLQGPSGLKGASGLPGYATLGNGQFGVGAPRSGNAPTGSLPFPPADGARDGRQSGADKQPGAACTFFLRTGTCAYGDRCKFKHPLDRPPPQLNSRGYPLRPDELDCAHYLKKGWCAFGPTCKFNHPELAPAILNTPSYNVTQPAAYVSANAYPSPTTVYSMPSMPAVYYLPSQGLSAGAGGLLTNPVGGGQLFQHQQQQQGLASGGAPQLIYAGTRQGVAAGGYGNMNSMAALQEAMQGLNLARAGGGGMQMHLGAGGGARPK